MPNTSSSSNQAVLEIKSATLYALRMVLRSTDMDAVQTHLQQLNDSNSSYLHDATLVLDVSLLDRAPDWKALNRIFDTFQLTVVGIYAPHPDIVAHQDSGLPLIESASFKPSPPPASPAPAQIIQEPSKTVVVERLVVAQPEAGTVPYPSIIIDKPLRSGQRVYARHADLIVLSVISHGAEVLADGNIHVYGPLRGRALAGAGGFADACIFTSQFDAELVSIAGVYKTFTAAPEEVANKPAYIKLVEDKIIVTPLTL